MSSRSCKRCGQIFLAGSAGVCYTCERIKREHKRYGRRRPAAKRAAGPEMSAAPNSRANQALGIARFLSVLSGRRTSLSQFLKSCGFTDSSVSRLKAGRILFQKEVCRHWCHLIRDVTGPDKAAVVIECFQLDGSPWVTEERARRSFQMSSQEAIVTAETEVLKMNNHLRKFEAMLVWVALSFDGLGECA